MKLTIPTLVLLLGGTLATDPARAQSVPMSPLDTSGQVTNGPNSYPDVYPPEPPGCDTCGEKDDSLPSAHTNKTCPVGTAESKRVDSIHYTVGLGSATYASGNNHIARDLGRRARPFKGYNAPDTDNGPLDSSLASEWGRKLVRPVIVGLVRDDITEATFTPAALELYGDNAGDAWVKKDAAGALRQILSDQYLSDITVPATGGVMISTWFRDGMGAIDPGTGLYTIPATAKLFRTIAITRPVPGALDTVDITTKDYSTAAAGPKIRVARWVKTGAGSNATWTLSHHTGEPTAQNLIENVVLAKTDLGGGLVQRLRTTSVKSSSGAMVVQSVTRDKYRDLGNGVLRVLERVEAPGTPAESTTTWTYTDATGTGEIGVDGTITPADPTVPPNQLTGGRVASLRRTGGYWEKFSYQYNPGTRMLTAREWSVWQDAPFGDTANCRERIITLEGGARTVIEKLAGQIIANTHETLVVGSDGSRTLRETRQGGSAAPAQVTETGYHGNTAAGPDKGRIKYQRRADGTLVRYTYANDAGGLRTTIESGTAGAINPAASGPVPALTAGTRVVRVSNLFEVITSETSTDIASGVTLSSLLVTETTPLGRPTRVIHDNNPDDHETYQYDCCGIASHRGRDGTVTNFLRDDLGRDRVTTTTTGARVTTVLRAYDADANGQPTITTTTSATGVAGQVVESTVSDARGRTITATRPGPMGTPESTSYAYSTDGRITTQTNPDGGTIITTSHADGQLHTITGTATIAKTYTYAKHAENGGGLVTTEITAGGVGGSVSSYSDLAGRTCKQTRTAPHGQTAITLTTYNGKGQVEMVTSSGQPAVKYLYNDEGERIATWTDRNGDGAFNDATVSGVRDACTTSESEYLAAANAPAGLGDCRRTITTVRTEANEDKVVSTSWQSVDGLRSRQETLGVVGATTGVQTRPMLGAASGTQTNPDGTSTVTTTEILANGNTRGVAVRKDANGNAIETSETISDSQGRTIQSTNGRGHVVQYIYNGMGGTLASVTQIAAAPGGGNLVTSYAHTLTPGTGTLVTTTLPDGTHQYQETNLLGQPVRQWGSQTNPVSFTYDAAGRRATLTTYRAPVGTNADTFPSITGDTTTWTYDPSGVLLTKTYADGKGPQYTYDIAGRMLTRTWARGVITTYAYVAGQLSSTTYSNDPANTPSVAVTYDRLGRQISSTSLLSSVLQSSVLYAYDPATLVLDFENITIDPDGPGPQPALTRILDRGRDTLGRESATGILPVSGGAAEHFINYGYDNSGRLSSVTSPAGTFNYTYAPGSSLISTVTGPIHTVTNTWEPNRNLLASKENKINSTGTQVSAFTYSVNPLNQRTSVQTSGTAFATQPADWNWGYDALGQVVSADSPTSSFDRAYEYDLIGNRKKSADSLTLPATDNYAANPLNQYEAVDSFAPTYDLDGNQIDAMIHPESAPAKAAVFVWDGENRLIAVKDKATSAVIVTYTYDAGSRRIARTEGSNTTVYLYDGWNCVADYTLQTSSFILQTSHTWGLDLSGSLQGAGGVCGLLAVSKHVEQGTKNDFYPSFDGNGNISEYLTATGSTAGHYEYDPFGRTVVGNGPQAADFKYRFSTKPVDPTTGLYYYGYRFYAPDTGRWINRDPIGENGGANLCASFENKGVVSFDVLGLVPGDSFDTFKEAYDDAIKYNKEKGKESLDNGWKKLEELTGLNRQNLFSYNLPKKYTDIMISAYDSGKGLLAASFAQDDMAVYVLEAKKATDGKMSYVWTFVLGREKASSVFCYREGVTFKFSYNFTEGTVLSEADAKSDPSLVGRVPNAKKLLMEQATFKGMPIVKHQHFIHTHLVDRFHLGTLSNYPFGGDSHTSISTTEGLSDADRSFGNVNGVDVTAIEDDGKLHVQYK